MGGLHAINERRSHIMKKKLSQSQEMIYELDKFYNHITYIYDLQVCVLKKIPASSVNELYCNFIFKHVHDETVIQTLLCPGTYQICFYWL